MLFRDFRDLAKVADKLHSATFTSELWSEMAKNLGIQYHLRANSLFPLLHEGCVESDDLRLPCVLLGLRTAPKDDLQCSSAKLVYGQILYEPGDYILDATDPWPLA
ncbi:hypothetical protein MHYP_G00195040 [Metynnis hypsauchen]